MTAHEVDYLLEELGSVVDAQPDAHPLRRVDRDASEIYETGESIDMQQPMHSRTGALKLANYVAVASETSTPTPAGPGQRYELQVACSIRVEGMVADKGGHIDGTRKDAVPFQELHHGVFTTIQDAMSYPDVGRPGVSYRDLKITNIDGASSNWADFSRASFDVVFRGYTDD